MPFIDTKKRQLARMEGTSTKICIKAKIWLINPKQLPINNFPPVSSLYSISPIEQQSPLQPWLESNKRKKHLPSQSEYTVAALIDGCSSRLCIALGYVEVVWSSGISLAYQTVAVDLFYH